MQSREELLKTIKSRILMINEDIRNNMTSLSLEGNFEEDSVSFYFEQQDKAIEYIQDVQHIQLVLQDLNEQTAAELKQMADSLLLKVKKEDVCSALSVETTGIYFRTKKLLIDTPNFKVTENGCYLNGTLYATSGEIGGWKIEGNSLVGQKMGDGDVSTIDGGTIEAKEGFCNWLNVKLLDFNPEYDYDYHTVDMTDAEISTSIDIREDTSFGDLTIWGNVTLEGENSLECGELHCTQLNGRGNGKYITIFCDEIVTEMESFSDERLKKDIRALEPAAGEMLMKLKPVTFRYKKNDCGGIGFIAQDVKALCEEYGFQSIVEENIGFYGIGYRQLVPILIRAIKNNMERIEELKNG